MTNPVGRNRGRGCQSCGLGPTSRAVRAMFSEFRHFILGSSPRSRPMIIKGGSRAAPGQLAWHLQRRDTNEKVEILEIQFPTSNLAEAFRDWQTISEGTRGFKGLYSKCGTENPVAKKFYGQCGSASTVSKTRVIPARKYDCPISSPSHIQLNENGPAAASSKIHLPASERRRPRRLSACA